MLRKSQAEMTAVSSPLGYEFMYLQEMCPDDSRAFYIYLMYVCGCFCMPEYMSVNDVPAWCPHGQEEGVEFSGTGVSDVCELPL